MSEKHDQKIKEGVQPLLQPGERIDVVGTTIITKWNPWLRALTRTLGSAPVHPFVLTDKRFLLLGSGLLKEKMDQIDLEAPRSALRVERGFSLWPLKTLFLVTPAGERLRLSFGGVGGGRMALADEIRRALATDASLPESNRTERTPVG